VHNQYKKLQENPKVPSFCKKIKWGGGERFNALMTSNTEHKLDAEKQLQYVTKLVTGLIFKIAMLTRIHFKVTKMWHMLTYHKYKYFQKFTKRNSFIITNKGFS